MKKWTGWRNCLAMCLAVTMLLTPFLQTEVYAAETANVQGTVASGTTAELLMLSTKDGKMEIKIDSSTDVSEARILLPETESYQIPHMGILYLLGILSLEWYIHKWALKL